MGARKSNPADSLCSGGIPRRAQVCLTFDFELAWGIHGEPGWQAYAKRLDRARELIDAICSLLDRLQVPATWATVGAIMLDGPDDPVFGQAIPPLEPDGETVAVTSEARWMASRNRPAAHWYGPDLIRRILACRVPQEIGCHSFTHQLFGPDVPARVVWDQLQRSKLAAARHGISLRSLVFPCNQEGHHGLVSRSGFTCFRGGGAGSSRFANREGGHMARGLRLADQAIGMKPRATHPAIDPSTGLCNVPASAFLMSLEGIRGLGGAAARERKFAGGLANALAKGSVFHIWTHPHNLMAEPERMLGLLERILTPVCAARDAGRAEVLTMGGVADAMLREQPTGSRE